MKSIIALILFLVPAAAFAQIPTRGNVFVGYSYGSADFSSNGRTNLNGWNGSLEGKVLPWVGFVADFSGLYGSQNIPGISAFNVDTKMNTVVLGPRVSVPVGKIHSLRRSPVRRLAHQRKRHGLFGFRHIVRNCSGRRHRLPADSRNRFARRRRHAADAFLQQHTK